ncbi:hypothetical protein PG997_010830 [Apiospora hydei]|uniref:Uncharacterized protein n=1 Tax=Apiospora hydei TaxID=1337664 RepID=A0ABR1VIB7_9PEZI
MDEKLGIAMDREVFKSSESSNTLVDKLEPTESKDDVSKGYSSDISDTVQESSWNKRFHYLTQGIENLPEWYSLPTGEISIEERQCLLELEVEHLIHASTTSATLPFHSKGLLGMIEGSELRKLSAMAHQILDHLSIVEIDNLCAVLETARSPKIERAATRALGLLYQKTTRSFSRQTASFDPISLEANARYELYAKLVDYTTSCVARLVTSYATGDTWSKTNLAVLGQLAVKLKFLARDSSQQAEASLRHAESVLIRFQKRDSEDSADGLSFDEESILESYDETFEDDYIRSSQGRQEFAMSALKRALGSLNLGLSPWRVDDLFQISSQIYPVGLDQTACALMRDEDSRVSITSTSSYVDFCRTGLALVRENLRSLANAQNPPCPAPPGAEPVTVSMDWQTAGSSSVHTSNMTVYTMDALLSLAIPLSLCSPQLGELGEQMITCLTVGLEPDGPPLHRDIPADKSETLIGCMIQSHGYSEQVRKESALHPDTFGLGPKVFDADCFGSHRDYRTHHHELQRWTIEDGSVTVKCRGYVAFILFLCAVITLVFTVPPGVDDGDPFLYAYVATLVLGSILFVAKSYWMRDWPWHDFLKGRIVCHSVSEVVAVTRVDEQVVLLKLLDHARASRFVTQGPYNAIFKRLDRSTNSDEEPEEETREAHSRSRALLSGAARAVPVNQAVADMLSDGDLSSGGFSIDRPLKLGTLYESGFLVLKVAGYNGEHLVCLDAHKEATVDFVDRSGKDAVLSCLNPPASRKGEASTVLLSQNQVDWTRFLGLYTGDVVFG